jgi:hypothetical protein
MIAGRAFLFDVSNLAVGAELTIVAGDAPAREILEAEKTNETHHRINLCGSLLPSIDPRYWCQRRVRPDRTQRPGNARLKRAAQRECAACLTMCSFEQILCLHTRDSGRRPSSAPLLAWTARDWPRFHARQAGSLDDWTLVDRRAATAAAKVLFCAAVEFRSPSVWIDTLWRGAVGQLVTDPSGGFFAGVAGKRVREVRIAGCWTVPPLDDQVEQTSGTAGPGITLESDRRLLRGRLLSSSFRLGGVAPTRQRRASSSVGRRSMPCGLQNCWPLDATARRLAFHLDAPEAFRVKATSGGRFQAGSSVGLHKWLRPMGFMLNFGSLHALTFSRLLPASRS